MSINYTSVIGVGVAEEDITYKSLTDQSKKIVQDIYIDSLSQEDLYDEDGERISDKDLLDDVDLNEWFLDNVGEYDIFDILGLQVNTGNYFTGEIGYRGVDVNLNSPEPAKEEFKKLVNLEPKIFNGVLVY